MNFLPRIFPFINWIKDYNKETFRSDLTAGLTVAVMLIPQGMAYAMIAGLPPVMGLYAVTLPLFIYALLGTSRQLAVGPVAMDSLLVAIAVGAVAQKGSGQYIQLAILLALMVGIIQFAMGIFRLGFLVNFLSHPVISGFTSAAALIIGFSQVKHLIGVDIPRNSHFHVVIMNIINRIGEIHWLTFLIGGLGIVALILLKKWKPVFPGALFLVVVGTVVVWAFRLDQSGVQIVGNVPAGLPSFKLHPFTWVEVKQMAPMALTIALVAFMEAISVAKAFAARERYHVDPNKELIAIGMANIGGSFFQSYPVTGGFSRTAINGQAGAKTTMSSVFSAILVSIALLFLTSLFWYLPKALLASIVMVAVFGLIDAKEPIRLWKIKRSDALLLLLSFGVTLFVGIGQGIVVSTLASLGVFIYRSTRPHTAVLGRLPNSNIFRNIERFPEAEQVPHTAILRIDASFYFANVSFFRDEIAKLLEEKGQDLKTLIFDMSGVNDIDSSAEEAIHEIMRELDEENIQLFLTQAKGPVLDVLKASGVYEHLGEKHFPMTIEEAIKQANTELKKQEHADA